MRPNKVVLLTILIATVLIILSPRIVDLFSGYFLYLFTITLIFSLIGWMLWIDLFLKLKKQRKKKAEELEIKRIEKVEEEKEEGPFEKVNKLVEIVNEKGSISVDELVKEFKSSFEEVEKLVNICAKYNLVKLEYPSDPAKPLIVKSIRK